jgi:hypothetical protein
MLSPHAIAIDKGTFLCHIVKALSKSPRASLVRAPMVL